jgi:hypothetical protein
MGLSTGGAGMMTRTGRTTGNTAGCSRDPVSPRQSALRRRVIWRSVPAFFGGNISILMERASPRSEKKKGVRWSQEDCEKGV